MVDTIWIIQNNESNTITRTGKVTTAVLRHNGISQYVVTIYFNCGEKITDQTYDDNQAINDVMMSGTNLQNAVEKSIINASAEFAIRKALRDNS